MKGSTLIFFSILLAVNLLTSCTISEEEPAQSTIAGKFIGVDEEITIKVRDYSHELDFSQPIYLDTVKTDAQGNFSFELKLDSPLEILLESNRGYQGLFLEGGDSIYFETEGKRKPLKNIGGVGSDKLIVKNATDTLLGFLKLADIDSAKLQSAFNERLSVFEKVLDSVKHNYSTDFYNYLFAKKLHDTYRYYNLFSSYLEMYKGTGYPKDSVAVKRSAKELSAFASEGYKNKFYTQILFAITRSKALKADSADAAKQFEAYKNLVEEMNIPRDGKEIMIGKGILDFLERGKVKEMEAEVQSFNKDYPQSVYKETLAQELNEWQVLSRGQPAPDFVATSLDGDEFKLSDLKDKVVYIDIWATWCGPCLSEFSHTKKIKKAFEGNDDIVFLYVSVDSRKQRWLNFLDNNELKGMHVHDPGNFKSEIAKTYKVQGIPRYMIIDQNGNIFSIKANRPSSGEKLIDQLNEALDKIKT